MRDSQFATLRESETIVASATHCFWLLFIIAIMPCTSINLRWLWLYLELTRTRILVCVQRTNPRSWSWLFITTLTVIFGTDTTKKLDTSSCKILLQRLRWDHGRVTNKFSSYYYQHLASNHDRAATTVLVRAPGFLVLLASSIYIHSHV